MNLIIKYDRKRGGKTFTAKHISNPTKLKTTKFNKTKPMTTEEKTKLLASVDVPKYSRYNI